MAHEKFRRAEIIFFTEQVGFSNIFGEALFASAEKTPSQTRKGRTAAGDHIPPHVEIDNPRGSAVLPNLQGQWRLLEAVPLCELLRRELALARNICIIQSQGLKVNAADRCECSNFNSPLLIESNLHLRLSEEEEQEPAQVGREGVDEEGSREGHAGREGARDHEEGGQVPRPLLQEVCQEIREEVGEEGRRRSRQTSGGDAVRREVEWRGGFNLVRRKVDACLAKWRWCLVTPYLLSPDLSGNWQNVSYKPLKCD